MIDTNEFAQRYREQLMDISAQAQGVSRVEALRRYHTDATYHATIEAIVMAALHVLRGMDEGPQGPDPLREAFDQEVGNHLLGWEPREPKH